MWIKRRRYNELLATVKLYEEKIAEMHTTIEAMRKKQPQRGKGGKFTKKKIS